MPFTVTMPKLSPTMEEGVIAKWHKKEGEFVDAGELLIEVTTDKATVEHAALDPGFLRKILTPAGANTKVNQPIAIFTQTQEESIAGYVPEGENIEENQEAEGQKEEVAEKATKIKEPVQETFAKASFAPFPPLEQYQFEFPRKPMGKRVFASPLARRMAEEKGLDLTSIKGSGPGGRVMSRDLKIAQPQVLFRASRQTPHVIPGSYEEEELSPMRKSIGRRLQQVKMFIPHFYVRITVNAENLVSLREQLQLAGLKLTYNDFLMKACAGMLKNHSEINSGYDSQKDKIIRFKTIDISIAVSIEGGLMTPIVRHVDYKSLAEISTEAKDLAQKAKSGKLEPHEYQGGSFTISNMGMFEVDDFQAIINPPQAAILAVGSIQDAPIVKEGKVVPGKTLNLVLSCDHRVIDGVAAAKFLQDLKKVLEKPAILLV